MKRQLIFLSVLILLWLIPALTLKATYGDSYVMWQTENSWVPDHNGGWVKNGEPAMPMPSQPSVKIPIYQQYLPLFLPMFVLALFLLTPLSKLLRQKAEPEESEEPAEKN